MVPKRAVQIGDLFAVRAPRGGLPPKAGLLGRVVSTSAIVGSVHGCNLVYVYRPGSGLARGDLLMPPMMTTRAPWSHGYFEFVRSEPLLPGAFFERHCFRDAHGHLYDEESRPVDAAFEPVGQWRLYEQVETIEEAITRALRTGS